MSKDGGPAFPQLPHPLGSYEHWVGMSLRDYFAAAALSTSVPSGYEWNKNMSAAERIAACAAAAYVVADAMLAERDKP